MIIVLTGADTFRSRERLRQLRDAFIAKYDPSGVSVATFDGGAARFEELQEAVASRGLLSTRRFVILERPLEGDRKFQESLAAFLRDGGVLKDSIVVLWYDVASSKRGKASANGPLTPSVLAADRHEDFAPLDPPAVERWIRKRVADQGGKIAAAAVQHLAAAVGSDLWMAANVINKVFHQTGGDISEPAVVADVTIRSAADIFAFSDALSRRDGRAAIRLLEQQFSSGANELYLLTMIARQVRILLMVGEAATTERHRATIATRLKLHPFVVGKAMEQIRTFSRRELESAHRRLIEIDGQLKTSDANPRLLLERFVIELCGLD